LLSDSCTLNHSDYVLEGLEYHLVIHDAEYVFSRVPMNSGPRGIPLPTL
jgi:hypothetical protein